MREGAGTIGTIGTIGTLGTLGSTRTFGGSPGFFVLIATAGAPRVLLLARPPVDSFKVSTILEEPRARHEVILPS